MICCFGLCRIFSQETWKLVSYLRWFIHNSMKKRETKWPLWISLGFYKIIHHIILCPLSFIFISATPFPRNKEYPTRPLSYIAHFQNTVSPSCAWLAKPKPQASVPAAREAGHLHSTLGTLESQCGDFPRQRTSIHKIMGPVYVADVMTPSQATSVSKYLKEWHVGKER